MSRTPGTKRSDELSQVELCARVDWLRQKRGGGPKAACEELVRSGFVQVIHHDKGMTLRAFGDGYDDAAWASRFSTLLRLPESSSDVRALVQQLAGAHRQKRGKDFDTRVETLRSAYNESAAEVRRARAAVAAAGSKASAAFQRIARRYKWLLGVYNNTVDGEGAEPGPAVYLALFGSGNEPRGARIHVELIDGRRIVSQRLDAGFPAKSIVRAIVAAPE